MGTAQLETLPVIEEAEAPFALREQVTARLAAHRQRRHHSPASEQPSEENRESGRKNRIAKTVADRYAQSPSYRAFLAAEAERAAERAAAIAAVAARNAEAAAAVQQELLSEMERWTAPQDFAAEASVVRGAEPVPAREVSTAGMTIRLYEELPARETTGRVRQGVPLEAEDVSALDDEIEFRKAPVFENYRSTEPAELLPANLLEFPRQLVAPRKARPRLAEGPLLERGLPGGGQLRIFEVEADQLSPAAVVESAAPEWSSIRLEAHTPVVLEATDAALPMLTPALQTPHTAPLPRRLMAAAVDGMLVALALVAASGVAVKVMGTVPLGVTAGLSAGGTLVAFYLLYQMLFFTLSDQTPGMRYARIGLCTFNDENPTRAAMRRRLLAKAVAVTPVGIGILWALLDDEGLGWHDRISGMYQRAY